ncbi:MAG: hypothetical protein EPO08_08225 [Rhodospirillaceae bacterium]|nr:MAG: hypothetical protein EPO08_08225 [Rhodospirillaceae bacterium]
MNIQRASAIVPPEGHFSPAAPSVLPKKKRTSWFERLRHRLARLFFPFKHHIPPNGVTPAEAVATFLSTMAAEAARRLPAWDRMLRAGLYDCGLSYDARHAFFDSHPVEDYHFAGIVALEASRIRGLYPPAEADALLAEIGTHVDTVAKRRDRIVSELVFEIIGRINMSQSPTLQKMPYDIATKAILEQLDIGNNEDTRPLMSDTAFRHAFGEPLATGFRDWWAAFQTRFVLYLPEGEEDGSDSGEMPPVVAAPVPARRPWRPRRAKPF